MVRRGLSAPVVLYPAPCPWPPPARRRQPSARIVLLKSLDARGFVFFTDYDSRKGRELADNPRAALLVYWRELERQVSVCGAASKVPREESEAYFQNVRSQPILGLPRASEAGGRPPDLEQEAGRSKEAVFRRPAPCPPVWGGFVVAPATIEFWQGRPDRMHDRFLYTRMPGGAWNPAPVALTAG